MKPHRPIALLLALATLAAVGGASRARADATCTNSTLVFYTSDSQNLAKALGAAASTCADYYISISPMTAAPNVGEPRNGGVVGVIHQQGPRFHAVAELQPKQWFAYAVTQGHGWYATGVKLHDDMVKAGYDPALGDTWAVNEIGSPSDSTVNTDPFTSDGDARVGFRDFVRGLYTGSSGPPLPGIVFAADAAQTAPDVPAYASALAAFDSDTPFWLDMQRYVFSWAQETYADARSWGVAGAPLDERTAYLKDYFLHGLRIAEQGNDATAAARAFLDTAYTPIANGSYVSPGPSPVTGIGFGYTAIGATGMEDFVSAQTDALRGSSPARFGFAFVPKNDGTDRTAIRNHLALAIQASQSDPFGACAASSRSCMLDVDGAAFSTAWKALANTPEGAAVTVEAGDGVSVLYDSVGARGATWFTSSANDASVAGFAPIGRAYDLRTTASFEGPMQVCLPNDTDVARPHLFQSTGDGWVDVTTSAGCGTTTTLGTFALFRDATPPSIVADVEGTRSASGWYTSDVTVSWHVADDQSPFTTSGCETVPLTTDTKETTITCTATSDGGETSTSVTLKRDATPPAITCVPTPSTLWPPNGKLVPVSVDVTLSDAISGAAGFTLTGVPATGVAGFTLDTPDVAGLLRAERPGNGGDRVYALTYTGYDVAGNAATCEADVTVPHDQGS